jgi:serine/threonine protein kinase
MVGKTLRNYRITAKLGVGGQGAVYKATDTKLGRPVVIKVIPPELSAKESNLKRFEREARLASSLDHPNICTIFDLDEVDGVHFIAMQYVEGKNVRQLVAGRPLELKTTLLIGVQVADALAAAHSRGIIHRDIKSGNVMVTPSGQVKVLDFGLAKLLDDTAAVTSGIHRTELTEVGVPYGTATYAAPEQARGDRVDKRADIFSLGVLLYEMLTGTWPFRGKTTIDVRHAVLHDPPRPIAELRSSPIPPRLQQAIDRALAKEPKDRFQNMEDFRNELRQVLRGCRWLSERGPRTAAPSLGRESRFARDALVEVDHEDRFADVFSEFHDAYKARYSRNTVHHSHRSGEEEPRDSLFPKSEQRSGVELLRVLACRCGDHRTRARSIAGGATFISDREIPGSAERSARDRKGVERQCSADCWLHPLR